MKKTLFPKRILAASQSYIVRNLPADAPEIATACMAYKTKWGIPFDTQSIATRWFGVFDKDDCVLVVGEKPDPEKQLLEVTDAYPVPGAGRRAVVAMWKVLMSYRAMHIMGAWKYFGCMVIHNNTQFKQILERVFGTGPMADVYLVEVK